MHGMVIVANNTVLYTGNLLREYILSFLTSPPPWYLCEVINMIVVIISQWIYTLNHAVHFEKLHVLQSQYIQFCQSYLNKAGEKYSFQIF